MRLRAPVFFGMNMIAVGGIVIGSNVGTALLLKTFGADILPWLFFAVAVLTITTEKLTGAFRRTISPELMLIGIVLFLNTLIGITWYGCRAEFAPAIIFLYVLPELAAFLVLTQVWNIAARYFDASESKHRFPMIAAGGSLGGMLSGIAVSFLVKHLPPLDLLFGWGALLVVLIPFAEFMKRSGTEFYPWSPTRGERAKDEAGLVKRVRLQLASVWSKRFYRGLLLTVALGTVLTFTLDYQSSHVFSTVFTTSEELTSFLGLFTSVAFFLGLIIQAFLITPIVTRVGLASAALIFPVATLLSSGVMLYSSALWAGVVGSFTRRYLKGSFFTVINDLLLNALHPQERPRVRALLKGTVTSSAAIFASAVIIAGQSIGGETAIAILGILVAIAYVSISFDLRTSYVSYLLKQMAKGRAESDAGDGAEHGLTASTFDPQYVLSALGSVGDDVALLMLDTTHHQLHPDVLKRLPEIYDKKSKRVRKAIIRCLALHDDPANAAFFNRVLIDNDAELLTELFRTALGSNRIPIGEQAALRSGNADDGVELRAAALAFLCRSREPHLAYLGYSRLSRYLSGSDRSDLLVCLDTMRLLRDRRMAWEFLPKLERDPLDPEYLSHWLGIMEDLEDGSDASFGEFYLRLFLTQPPATKRRALQLIGRIPPNRIFTALWEHLGGLADHEQCIILNLGRKVDLIKPSDLAELLRTPSCPSLVFREAAKTWKAILNRERDAVLQARVSRDIQEILDQRVKDLRSAVKVTKKGSLLVLVIAEDVRRAAENVMAWKIEQCADLQSVDTLFNALVSDEKDATDKAVETIENIAGMNLVSEVQSLIGLLSDLKTGAGPIFSEKFEMKEEPGRFLARLVTGRDPWTAAVALHELAKGENAGIMKMSELKTGIPAGHFDDKYFVEAVKLMEEAA